LAKPKNRRAKRKGGLGETLGGIIQNPQVDFVQKKFGFRPKDTAILNSGSEVNVHVIIMLSAHGSAG